MSAHGPADCLVTMEQLSALERGRNYIVKIRDIDGVNPESRGMSFMVLFRQLLPTEGPLPLGFSEDPRAWMVQGHDVNRTDTIYGFHAWLIESIEAI